LQRNLNTPLKEIQLRHRCDTTKSISARLGMKQVQRMSWTQRCDQLWEAKEERDPSRRDLANREQVRTNGRCAHRALDLCAVITGGAEPGNDRAGWTHRKPRPGSECRFDPIVEISRRPKLHHFGGGGAVKAAALPRINRSHAEREVALQDELGCLRTPRKEERSDDLQRAAVFAKVAAETIRRVLYRREPF